MRHLPRNRRQFAGAFTAGLVVLALVACLRALPTS